MGVNKVVMNTPNGEETIIDLTDDSVIPETLPEGVTAHDASGEPIVGTMVVEKIPDYVKTEAETVIERVLAAQGDKTFNIITMTDLHNNGGVSDAQILHACQGAGYVADRVKIDAFARLGDHTDLTGQTNSAETRADIIACNNHIHKYLDDVEELALIGNHDFEEKDSPITHKLISAFSKDVVWGSKLGGYFYKDYEAYKLRIVGLNTSETASGWNATAKQINWFIDVLDLSAKEDAVEWQTLIMSHVPLDWQGFVFPYILQAYINGTSWSDGTYSCDYTEKNQATIIANVHGHIHNFQVEKMYLGGTADSEQIDLYRICIPEVTESYQNHYSAPFKNDTTYPKTVNTAEDTSFNVLCIDLDSKTIEAVCYGAGIDRTIKYTDFSEDSGETDEPTVTYTNQIPISTDATGAIYKGVGYADSVRIGSDGTDRTDAPVDATGFIPCTYGQKLYFENCQILNDGTSTYQHCVVYDSAKTYLGAINLGNARTEYLGFTVDENNCLTSLDTGTFIDTYTDMGFVRFTGNYIGADSIITVNEPITDNTSAYTNLIPLSINADGTPYVGHNG